MNQVTRATGSDREAERQRGRETERQAGSHRIDASAVADGAGGSNYTTRKCSACLRSGAKHWQLGRPAGRRVGGCTHRTCRHYKGAAASCSAPARPPARPERAQARSSPAPPWLRAAPFVRSFGRSATPRPSVPAPNAQRRPPGGRSETLFTSNKVIIRK